MILKSVKLLWDEGLCEFIRKSKLYLEYRNTQKSARLRRIKYIIQYGSAAPDPKKLIEVNASDIDYVLIPSVWPYQEGTWVIDGDWDIRRSKNERIPAYTDWDRYVEMREEREPQLYKRENFVHYESFRKHFEEEVPWEDTEFYKELHTDIEKNNEKYHPKDKIESRLSTDDNIYNSIVKSGYKTQEEIQSDEKLMSGPDSENEGSISCDGDEIGVGITRDGEVVKVLTGGGHRFTIAKVLDLENIPVEVKLRHKKWQEKREKVAKGDVPDGVDLSHPDLQDVL